MPGTEPSPSAYPRNHPLCAPSHAVAVVGGGVAGSEAASLLASHGVLVVVFEQNTRPYGKIEDGLPRWHVALRRQEYERIDRNLDHPLVLFVPRTRLGHDVGVHELVREWGFSGVVLAHGAWRDRPIPVPGIESYDGRGLVYQNPLVYWFNHCLEEGFEGPSYEIPDGTIVVGGGLASIDVVKILNLELYARALRARGIGADLLEMERSGIPAVLARHGLNPENLGVRGCTLFYRRRKRDMSLASAPPGATPEQLRKTESIREKIMDLCARKYLVRLEECLTPAATLVAGDRLVGLRFRRTELLGERFVEIPGSERDVHAPLTVGSIGSIPEPIDGIPLDGELYRWSDHETGELADVPGVFGLGNVLTGKGNIKESRANARKVMDRMIEAYLGLGANGAATGDIVASLHDAARSAIGPLARNVAERPRLDAARLNRLVARVRSRWTVVGYTGDYRAWLARFPPFDRR
ncbi:MAG: FAD-dependent oxidoreductase [Candidatus Binatia bacterium]